MFIITLPIKRLRLLFMHHLNWRYRLLILIFIFYIGFCAFDFFSQLVGDCGYFANQNAPAYADCVAEGKTGHFSGIDIIELLAGMLVGGLGLYLVISGRRVIERDARNSVKIELLNQRLNKLTEQINANDDLFPQIEGQFNNWNLTKSESEIALLLLKGLTFKEMSEVRGSSEKTIRHQASSIYAKSAQAGRNEFSAYFFELLMEPK